MRTFLLLFISILFAGTLCGQISFEDDFESYNVGDGIAASSPDFVLWPSAAAIDALITDEQAASGEKSIALPGGQDIDILLNFGDQYTEGSFRLDFDVFVPTGRNAYFNFQGSDAIGTAGNWVLQCYLNANGIFVVDNSIEDVFSNAYPQNEWITIGLDINLTENLWKMYINDECLGSFRNTDANNQIYSMNLYPPENISLSYVDNMSFSHNPVADEIDIAIDAAAAGAIDIDAGIGRPQVNFYGIAGTEQDYSVRVRNDGTETIETFSINIEGAGVSATRDFTQTIAPGETASVELDQKVTFGTGDDFALFNITTVNGVADDNTCNNGMPLSFSGFEPAPDKKVFVEESTGRGCTWCPRGHVYMNYMANKYGDLFVGSAVHNDDQGLDPMTNNEWDSGMLQLTSQPSLWIDRDTALIMDPSQMETAFITSVTSAPILTLNHQGRIDDATRTLDVQVRTDFTFAAIRTGTRLFVGLIEDGVQGVGAGYAQTNAYSGGGQGPMGGYENLASPVPADQMIYNEVARVALSGGPGLQDAYQDVEDKTIIHSFTTEIPAAWNIDNMSVVSAFIGPDGRVFNAQKTTVAEAVANGYTTTIDPVLDQGISVFPNPTNGLANITLEFDTPTDVTMEVSSATGQIISTEKLGTITGTRTINFDGSTMDAGIYYLSFRSGTESTIKRLVITD